MPSLAGRLPDERFSDIATQVHALNVSLCEEHARIVGAWENRNEVLLQENLALRADLHRLGKQETGSAEVNLLDPERQLSCESRSISCESSPERQISAESRRGVQAVGSGGKAAARPSTASLESLSRVCMEQLFPHWFNPFVSETYCVGVVATKTSSLPIDEYAGLFPKPDKSRCVLKPMGSSVTVWNMLFACFLVYDLWITPLESFFLDPLPDQYRTLSMISLCFFCCDIVLNFFTGYVDGDKEVLQHHLIMKAYLKSWFWIDVVATVPWDDLFGQGQEVSTSRSSRAVKVAKAVKVVKAIRLLRIARFRRNAKNVRLARYHKQLKSTSGHGEGFAASVGQIRKFLRPVKHLALPLQAMCLLVALAHAHSWIYALSKPSWTTTSDVDTAFDRYYESLSWYFRLMVFGNPSDSMTDDLWGVEVIVLIERVFLLFHGLSLMIFGCLVFREEEATLTLKYSHAMEYMRRHDVSARTRSQVQFNVSQTSKTQNMHRHFLELMENNLPRHLQCQICEELWSKHVQNFSLFSVISNWHSGFIRQLCMIITEHTFASKAVVFQEGDAVNDAFMVVAGRLCVTSSTQDDVIPDFTTGMWIGEKGLINLGLRRSGTCTTDPVSKVIFVPTNQFQSILEDLGLLPVFQEFCCTELWKGLCGRCGDMGDHFSSACPLVAEAPFQAQTSSAQTLRKSSFGDRDMLLGRRLVSNSLSVSHETKMYLQFHGLGDVIPELEHHGLLTLDEISTLGDETALLTVLGCTDRADLFTEIPVTAFRNEMSNRSRKMLNLRMAQHEFFMFLSHFKFEAGTEASLMRAELQKLINEDSGHAARELDTAIFLDSEDLTDLEVLVQAVLKSHNLVILLTPGVLARPWCLVEIASAVRANLNLVPVIITKPGLEFHFPDEGWYADFANGAYLDVDAVKEVNKHGFELTEVAGCIRKVFATIALPYSPHRPSAIRSEECRSILSRCKVRGIDRIGKPTEKPVNRTSAPTSSARFSTPADSKDQTFRKGDKVKVVNELRMKGKLGIVLEPDWYGFVKIEIADSEHRGQVKSYKCFELEPLEDAEFEGVMRSSVESTKMSMRLTRSASFLLGAISSQTFGASQAIKPQASPIAVTAEPTPRTRPCRVDFQLGAK